MSTSTFAATFNISTTAVMNITMAGNPYMIAEECIVALLLAFSLYGSIVAAVFAVRCKVAALRKENILFVLSVGILLLRACFFEVEIHVPASTTAFCVAFSAINVVLANINRGIVYLILWMRQRTFYQSPILTHLNSKYIKVMSKTILIGIVTMPMVLIGMLVAIPIQFNPDQSCHTDRPNTFLQIAVPVVYALQALIQIFLLALVLYPIIKHIIITKFKRNNKMASVVIRLSVSTTVCVLTDIAFTAFSINPSENYSFHFLAIIYGTNTLINVCAVAFSYTDYLHRLFPCIKKKHQLSSAEASTVRETNLAKSNP